MVHKKWMIVLLILISMLAVIMLFVSTNTPAPLSKPEIANELRRYIVSLRLESANHQLAENMSDVDIYDEKIKPLIGHAAKVTINKVVHFGSQDVDKGIWEVYWMEESVPYRATIQCEIGDGMANVNPLGIKVTDINILRVKL